MRRLLLWLFPFFAAGILFYGEISLPLAGAASAALFFILYVKHMPRMALFCVLFAFFGYTLAAASTAHFASNYKALEKAEGFSGYVLDRQDHSLVVKNYREGYRIVVSFYNGTEAVPGDIISFLGKVKEKPEYKVKIMNAQGIDAYVSGKQGTESIQKNQNPFILPARLRYRLSSALIGLDPEGGSFISGLVTGKTDGLEETTLENFQNLGISHILAVSGFNLAIIFYAVRKLSEWSGLKKRSSLLVTLAVCLVYTAMGAFEPSVLRAFIMAIAVVAAKLMNRHNDVLSGIVLTAWVMLTINPFYIYHLGFLLSFAAAIGIIVLSGIIEEGLPARLTKGREAIAVSLAAFLATLPMMLWFKGEFSLITLVVNIIISPFVAILTILSFVCALLWCFLGFVGFLYLPVSMGSLFIQCLNLVSNVNKLVVTGAPPIAVIVFYYLFIAMAFGLFRSRSMNKIKWVPLGVAMLVVVLCTRFGDGMLKVHFINVGQGQSVLLETPSHESILIDTGPSTEGFSMLKKRVLPYVKRLGYGRLSALVLSHFHNDHAGDYEYLFQKKLVDQAYCYRVPPNVTGSFRELSKGDEINTGEVRIKVLYPEAGNTNAGTDENEECLVMELNYKNFTMLLPGDVESEVIKQFPGRYDVFNLSHHGSVKSFSEEMVKQSTIGSAVVSVGHNSFGHPSPKVIAQLVQRGIPVYRTDKLGSIIVSTDGDKYSIVFQ